MGNNYLALSISNKYIQNLQPSVSPLSICESNDQQQYSTNTRASALNQESNSPLREPAKEVDKAIEVPQEVKKDFLNLTRLFSALVTEIEGAFRRSDVPLQDIQRFVEEECELSPLSGAQATIENVFSRVRQHYSLLDYTLLEFLVQTFLSENKPLLQKLMAYSESVDAFKNSAKLIHLMGLIEKQITTDRHKIVKLKSREFWGKIRLKKLETFVTEILHVLYNQVSQISVGRGCICVSAWMIPDIADPLSLIPSQPQAFIKAMGIVSLHIGDSVVYDIPGEGCEVMEAAMLQAIELKSTRAIELLQAIGYDPEVEEKKLTASLKNEGQLILYVCP